MNPGITSKYFTGTTNTFFARLAEGILRFRWLLLLLVFLLTIFAFYEMRTLRMDNSNEAFFLEGDPTKLLLDKFRDTFGNEDFVYVLIETRDFFESDTIRLIKKLAEDLEEHVPYVKDMKFLGNIEYVEGMEGGIEISDLIEEIPETLGEMELVKERAMNEPLPIIDYELDEMTARELSLFGIVCIVLQMLILLWVARGARGVVTPLLVVILSIFWTLGVAGTLDWTLSLAVVMLPILLICVGIGDSMHIIAETQDQQDRGLARRQAIVKSLALVGIPCLLTSFLSFLGTVIKPMREMGVYAAIGVILALVLSLIMVPIMFSFGKNKKKVSDLEESPTPKAKAKERSFGRNDIFDRMLEVIAFLNLKYPRAILSIFVTLIIVSLFGYSLVEIETKLHQEYQHGSTGQAGLRLCGFTHGRFHGHGDHAGYG
jgi:predicted RND superfamily exporter protein